MLCYVVFVSNEKTYNDLVFRKLVLMVDNTGQTSVFAGDSFMVPLQILKSVDNQVSGFKIQSRKEKGDNNG